MSLYDDVNKIAFEKAKQQIYEQISKDNAFYRYYVKKKTGGTDVKLFENTKGGHNKWWKVYPPYEVKGGIWGVRVEFGKIGKSGQTRVHAEATEDLAWRYYSEKLDEKKRKGYTQKSATSESAKLKQIKKVASKPVTVSYSGWDTNQASAVKAPPAKPQCSHATLTIAGANKWKCGTCKTVIEFGKSLPSMQEEEVNEAVRYINLSETEE